MFLVFVSALSSLPLGLKFGRCIHILEYSSCNHVCLLFLYCAPVQNFLNLVPQTWFSFSAWSNLWCMFSIRFFYLMDFSFLIFWFTVLLPNINFLAEILIHAMTSSSKLLPSFSNSWTDFLTFVDLFVCIFFEVFGGFYGFPFELFSRQMNCFSSFEFSSGVMILLLVKLSYFFMHCRLYYHKLHWFGYLL